MHFGHFQALLSLVALTFCRNLESSCAITDASVCAEVYNTTDCTGLVTVVIGAGCHNIIAISGGSINVRKGSVFAGFRHEECRGDFELLTGPRWKETDQGCEKITSKNTIKSWNAWVLAAGGAHDR
ncbi:hypothetical protein K505DRAFT_386319 [Melanomma pulvis-pyrius CBS 109.77]|uniref:Uncharacterized protein n=1 Tax=Melanomma pulvis-pyrius CBS 109.77 TaxID=1314802 RepID=A0A6A6X9X6_9PLEO|nr:hypothetical protein K505DRAFT_386319 [Melanomma pulvis-pyrius CBS 109.77]